MTQQQEPQYISTRGLSPSCDFSQSLLHGLAPDGGLYVPRTIPLVSPKTIESFATMTYTQVAQEILRHFVGKDFSTDTLEDLIHQAYSQFDHHEIAPLIPLEKDLWLMELFHGPTLAFKDIAMQLMAGLFDYLLKQKNQHMTILGATSGDTGAAGVHAFKNRANADIFMLFPHNRVSAMQRQQMTTVKANNVHVVAIDGTFDDCQNIVKALFGKPHLRQALKLSAVNSINWARIAIQTVYYFTAAARLGASGQKIAFSVPTGNFGDIYAGYVAARMGLPISQLMIATNTNDILARALKTGSYTPGETVKTLSPSMDIQVASNFERLLYEAGEQQGDFVRDCMDKLKKDGGFTLPKKVLETIRTLFTAARVGEEKTLEVLKEFDAKGIALDPHTAVGVAAARTMKPGPTVCLATAHAAKFSPLSNPKTPLATPPQLRLLQDKPEYVTMLPADTTAVEDFMIKTVRKA